jgi:hypothetical protein
VEDFICRSSKCAADTPSRAANLSLTVTHRSSVLHFKNMNWDNNSRDSSVGIALGYGLHDRGCRVRFPAGDGNSSLNHRVQNGSGPTQPPIQWVPAALSVGVKRPGREVDHSLPSSAKVKNAWSYTFTPQYVFMA